MKYNPYFKTLLLSAACVITFLSGCKKETITPTANNTGAEHSSPIITGAETPAATYYLKGTLGSEQIIITGTPLYYTDAMTPSSTQNSSGGNCGQGNQNQNNSDGQHGGGDNHSGSGDGEGGNGHNDDSDNTDGVHKGDFICGAQWVDSANNQTVTATLEIRRLSVRVYVAPITAADERYNLASLGMHDYSYNSTAVDEIPANGVYLSLRDSKGVVWTTRGEQAGSTFQITSRGEKLSGYTTIAGTLTAKMYDSQGNMKVLSGGAFSAIIGL